MPKETDKKPRGSSQSTGLTTQKPEAGGSGGCVAFTYQIIAADCHLLERNHTTPGVLAGRRMSPNRAVVPHHRH